jgi:cell division cycle 2-like protein
MNLKDLGTPNERIWPGYKDMPFVKKLTFGDFPYNTLRSRFGKYLTDSGFELLIK